MQLTLEDLATGKKWYVIMNGRAQSFTFPGFSETSVLRGHDYEWNLTGFKFPNFRYDEFRWDYLEAVQEDVSLAKKRVLKIR